MKAKEYADAMMPGYTHLPRAQPVPMGHHLLAYVEMLDRDADRLKDCRRRLNVSPVSYTHLPSWCLQVSTTPLNPASARVLTRSSALKSEG